MSRLTRDGTAKPVPRDQILRRERGRHGNIQLLPCSAHHEQDWQSYPVDPFPDTYLFFCSFTVFSLLHGECVVRFPLPDGVTWYVCDDHT